MQAVREWPERLHPLMFKLATAETKRVIRVTLSVSKHGPGSHDKWQG